tara:strand:- start:9695 stop:10060 length:366 start_codon:yes stop_codon:yes gene_type:complete
MNFTQGQEESMPHQTKPKANAQAKIEEGKQEIGKAMTKIQQNDKVQAATRAAKDGAKKAVNTVAGIFGMGKDTENTPPPNQFGGKRRRKSRRKKRTKRRRKSRRKKRRTKRRRKSRRKRRR